MQWTDRIRQVKIILVLAAIIIAVASLIVSNNLVKKLADEEHNKMEVWAEAMRSLNKADENTDLNLVLKVINENNTIPVIVTDSKRNVQIYRNVNLKGINYEDSLKNAGSISEKLLNEGKFIRIYLDDSLKNDYINVCYDDSVILKRLSTYPYIQLGVVMLFVVVCDIRTAYIQKGRAKQSVGRSVQGNSPPARHAYFEPYGMDRDIKGELS
mgnify:CR=1 FL=1